MLGGSSEDNEKAQSLIAHKTPQQETKSFSEVICSNQRVFGKQWINLTHTKIIEKAAKNNVVQQALLWWLDLNFSLNDAGYVMLLTS